MFGLEKKIPQLVPLSINFFFQFFFQILLNAFFFDNIKKKSVVAEYT